MSPGCHAVETCSGPHAGSWFVHFAMKRIMLKPVATTARVAVVNTAPTHREIAVGLLIPTTSETSSGLSATKSSRSSFLKLIRAGSPDYSVVFCQLYGVHFFLERVVGNFIYLRT